MDAVDWVCIISNRYNVAPGIARRYFLADEKICRTPYNSDKFDV